MSENPPAAAAARGDMLAGKAERGDARPVRYRGAGFNPRTIGWLGALFFVALAAFWQFGSQAGWISQIILPSPGEALGAFVDLVRSGDIWRHLSASIYRLFWGWTLGTFAGVAVGVAAGLFTFARSGIVPLVAAFFPIPKIALLPLFIIWFGIGEESKIATIFFGVFFPTVIAVYGGVDNVDRQLVRMGQSFGLSWWSIVAKIVLPGAMPAILSGFRISTSIAIILLVAAEMIGAEYGIGAYVLLAGNLMATDQLIAGVALLSMLGLTVSAILGRLERLILRWR